MVVTMSFRPTQNQVKRTPWQRTFHSLKGMNVDCLLASSLCNCDEAIYNPSSYQNVVFALALSWSQVLGKLTLTGIKFIL